MYNDEIPDHDTVIISSDSSNCDDDDVEMVSKMKKFNFLESITMESENTEVKIEGDKIKITGKAKVNFSKDRFIMQINGLRIIENNTVITYLLRR
ncbi:4279_t:CDS:2 [Gigaspora margarita]|uniref:4279_t:CDS:1 n=1 Tax=Gigaspora margarita TaxID=4874 RepID=A0ABN7VPF3_GIGMA|nr:4279_t:CDS:2 [Gigaspora margarita]